MVNINVPPVGETKVDFAVGFNDVNDENTREISVREVTLGESLLTPGLQTSVLVNSFLHASPDSEGKAGPSKNFDDFKNKMMEIAIVRPILEKFDMESKLLVAQRIYRISDRKI